MVLWWTFQGDSSLLNHTHTLTHTLTHSHRSTQSHSNRSRIRIGLAFIKPCSNYIQNVASCLSCRSILSAISKCCYFMRKHHAILTHDWLMGLFSFVLKINSNAPENDGIVECLTSVDRSPTSSGWVASQWYGHRFGCMWCCRLIAHLHFINNLQQFIWNVGLYAKCRAIFGLLQSVGGFVGIQLLFEVFHTSALSLRDVGVQYGLIPNPEMSGWGWPRVGKSGRDSSRQHRSRSSRAKTSTRPSDLMTTFAPSTRYSHFLSKPFMNCIH